MNIDCGDWTYGLPKPRLADVDHPRRLDIGRYCGIGDEVQIVVGRQGRNPIDTLTTYPLLMAVSQDARKYDRNKELKYPFVPSKNSNTDHLDVRIGHAVWIGARVIIMAGVTIGTGAIIATRSVVNRDIPPYAIAAGVPARVKTYRHDPDTIAAILASEWWRLDPDDIWLRCGSLIGSSDARAVAALLTGDPDDG